MRRLRPTEDQIKIKPVSIGAAQAHQRSFSDFHDHHSPELKVAGSNPAGRTSTRDLAFDRR